MEIRIGWGRFTTRFVPRIAHYEAHIEFLWREGNWRDSVQGSSFIWSMPPTGIPKLIDDLTKMHEEYLTWVKEERARPVSED